MTLWPYSANQYRTASFYEWDAVACYHIIVNVSVLDTHMIMLLKKHCQFIDVQGHQRKTIQHLKLVSARHITHTPSYAFL